MKSNLPFSFSIKKSISILVFLIGLGVLLNQTSCLVTTHHDNGKHKGWNKNRHNPHHPATDNPGHSKKKKNKKH